MVRAGNHLFLKILSGLSNECGLSAMACNHFRRQLTDLNKQIVPILVTFYYLRCSIEKG